MEKRKSAEERKDEILNILEDANRPMKIPEIMKHFNLTKKHLLSYIDDMAKDGIIVKEHEQDGKIRRVVVRLPTIKSDDIVFIDNRKGAQKGKVYLADEPKPILEVLDELIDRYRIGLKELRELKRRLKREQEENGK